MTAWFPKGKRELEVSLFQALVLLCFNSDLQPFQTMQSIAATTRIDQEELKRTILSLCNGLVGTRVLTKTPKGDDTLPLGPIYIYVYNIQ